MNTLELDSKSLIKLLIEINKRRFVRYIQLIE